jgi:hypothetical protein
LGKVYFHSESPIFKGLLPAVKEVSVKWGL